MTNKFIESLGWEFEDCWNNRNYYTIGDVRIAEHCGDVFPYHNEWDQIMYEHKFSEESLKEYSRLVNILYNMLNNPGDCTLKEYIDVNQDIENLIRTLPSGENFND